MNVPIANRVLGMYADLIATSRTRDDTDRKISVNDFCWLPDYNDILFTSDNRDLVGIGATPAIRSQVERLLKTSILRADEVELRIGRNWLQCGRGASLTFTPLESMAIVKAPSDPGPVGRQLQRLGRPEVPGWIPNDRTDLFDAINRIGEIIDALPRAVLHSVSRRASAGINLGNQRELARVKALAAEIAAAAGERDPVEILGIPPDDRPRYNDRRSALMTGVALYLREVPKPSAAGSELAAWARRDLQDTAFAGLFDLATRAEWRPDLRPPDLVADVLNPMPLDWAQRGLLLGARERPRVMTLSGPPGTGKSHTLVATALDAVLSGESVLIGASSPAAVNALVELLGRVCDVRPVVFGGAGDLDATMVGLLEDGGGQRVPSSVLAERGRAAQQAGQRYRTVRERVAALLNAESRFDGMGTDVLARSAAPGFFDPSADHAEIARLFAAAGDRSTWWRRRRAARALQRLRALSGASPDTALHTLAGDFERAGIERSSAGLVASGGLELTGVWPQLLAAENEARATGAQWVSAWVSSEDRVDRAARGTMSVLAAAMRSGRQRRRQVLAELPGRSLGRALPVWIGTLRDIEDLLPAQPGLFDLVIVDEASQVDQPTVASALLRGRRAVVAGDPQQLRHVSFLSDSAISEALDRAGLTDPTLAGRLDVRRLSAYDLAASAAPVINLSTHYRGVRHLVGFSAARFYRGELMVGTLHPANEDDDRIDVLHVDGSREDGVNRAEVKAVVELIRTLWASGAGSIGVVTPFRAQADALNAAAQDAFKLEQLVAMKLRIGTVHGFQGGERDHIILSLAVSSADGQAFINDPNLFNVMITRARQRLTVVTSLQESEATGLLADYLRYAGSGPAPVQPVPVGEWPQTVAARLADDDTAVRTGFPAGHHLVDVVLGEREQARGLHTEVHPAGGEAHIDRYLELTRCGWVLAEGFRSRWGQRPSELAINLRQQPTVAARSDNTG